MVVARVKGFHTGGPWSLWVETGEGSDLCLTQFLVANDPGAAPFTSIITAYAAAKAAGHGAASPAQILVCPGTYVGDLLLDTPGIDIIAVSQDSQQPGSGSGIGHTVVDGQVTFDLAFAGTRLLTTMRWQGIDIRPSAGPAVIFGGPNAQAIYLVDAAVETVSGPAIIGGNSGVDGFLSSVLDVQNCTFRSGGADAVIWGGGPFPASPTLRGLDCEFSTLTGGTRPIIISEAIVLLETCLISGEISNLIDDGALLGRDCVFLAQGAAEPVALVSATGFFQAMDCELRTDPDTVLVAGAGLFVHDGLTSAGGSLTWDTALFVVPVEAVPQEAHIREIDVTAAPVEITGQTNITVTAGPAGGTLILPPVFARPGVLRIKLAEGATGPVTVAAQAGEDIRLGGDPPVASFPLTADGVFLVSDPAFPDRWEGWVFGGAGVNCLGNFLVSPDPATAPFQSIQAAYDAAVLAGADPVAPAKILVCPGFYSENVLMSQPGIDIVAVAPDDFNQLRGPVDGPVGITILSGTLTVDLTGFSPSDEEANGAWRGIDILPPPEQAVGNCIIFTGIGYQLLFISDCYLLAADNFPALLMDNSGVGSPGDSRVDAIHVGFDNPSAASAAAFNMLAGQFIASNCRFIGAEPNIVADGTFVNMVDCENLGVTEVEGTYEHTYGSLNLVVFTGSTGILDVTQVDFIGALPFAGGPGPGFGRFFYDSIVTQSTGGTALDPAIGSEQKSSLPPGDGVRFFSGIGPHVLTGGETNVLVDPLGGAATVVMPDLVVGVNVRWGPIRVKNRNSPPAPGGGTVAIAPAAGNAINEGAGFGVLGPGAGVTFVSWPSPAGGGIPSWESYD